MIIQWFIFCLLAASGSDGLSWSREDVTAIINIKWNYGWYSTANVSRIFHKYWDQGERKKNLIAEEEIGSFRMGGLLFRIQALLGFNISCFQLIFKSFLWFASWRGYGAAPSILTLLSIWIFLFKLTFQLQLKGESSASKFIRCTLDVSRTSCLAGNEVLVNTCIDDLAGVDYLDVHVFWKWILGLRVCTEIWGFSIVSS